MQVGVQRGAHNPNKGMDVKKYLQAIGVGLLIFLVSMLVWARHTAKHGQPNVQQRSTPAGGGTTVMDKGK